MGSTTTVTETSALAQSLDPTAILDSIRSAGVTHIVTVPDTHQKSLLALLSRDSDPPLITVCTEDEAYGVNTGLFLGGARPLLLVQNAGLFASMNSLRGLALDGRVPTCLLVGEYMRDPAVPARENAARVVRLVEPTLDAWGVPTYRLDTPSDLPNIGRAVEHAFESSGPAVLLVGAPTKELS